MRNSRSLNNYKLSNSFSASSKPLSVCLVAIDFHISIVEHKTTMLNLGRLVSFTYRMKTEQNVVKELIYLSSDTNSSEYWQTLVYTVWIREKCVVTTESLAGIPILYLYYFHKIRESCIRIFLQSPK